MATVTERPVRTAVDVREGGDRFVGVGLLLLPVLFVGVQVLAGEVIPPLAVPALVYLVLGLVILRRRSRWLLITAIVLPLLHLVASIPFIAAALAHPESPASFLPDAFIGIAALSVVAGAIAGLLGAGPGSRRPITLVAGVVAAGAVILSLASAAGVESDARQAGDIPVEAVRAQFPERVDVAAGGAVLWVDNQDPFRHTFVIEGADVHVELPGSASVRVETDLAPGSYRYFCDVPGHDGMEGALVAR